jgi:UV excision repair protein RAD23
LDGFLCEECADIFFLLLLYGRFETVQAKIEAKLESGGAPVSKVIHKGKVLEEGKPVSDYGVADADMFVVMVNKAKPKAATEPTVDAATKPVAPTVPAQAPAAAPAPATAAAVPAGGGSQSYESSAATMVLGEEVEATVMQIMEMGFEREQVMKAMRAAFMNPDRAVEYLMSGIPEQSQRPQGQDSEDGRAVDPALMAALQQQMLGGQVLVSFGYPLFPFAVPFLALN